MQTNLLENTEVKRLAGNCKVLAEMCDASFELVREQGSYRTYLDGERMSSARKLEYLISDLTNVLKSIDRVMLDALGDELVEYAKQKKD